MTQKILTVSVAAYNVQSFIRECLDSLAVEEILDKLEVLIIDDGGKDQTLEIAKEYEAAYPGTFFAVHKENGGWGSTVNTGIAMASGKYFKQLDGDDYYLRNNLSEFVRLLSETDADIVVTPWREFDAASRKSICMYDLAAENHLNYYAQYSADQFPDSFFPGMHGCAFKTKMLKEKHVTIIEHAFYTDNELIAQGITFAETYVFLPIEVYQYRLGQQTQSVSMESRKKHYKDLERVITSILRFSEQTSENANVRFLVCRTKGMILYYYHICLLLAPTEEHKAELKAFDQFVKEKRYDAYKNAGEMMTRLRLTNYRAYKLLCWIIQRRQKRK